ncbi:MAG: HEPN domain-containing protein [Cyclobacteriaceae bacterium]|jgi:HEPN domain-containing protein
MGAFKFIGFAILIICMAYIASKVHLTYKDDHVSLNDANLNADMFLKNARLFAKEGAYDRSLFHLQSAVKSLKNLELDVDVESSEYVETAIEQLEDIERELLTDSLKSDDMNAAFSNTMNIISLAELRVSEKYADSNNHDMAIVALKYARLHIKNALDYPNLPNRKLEMHIYYELDSLIKSPEISPVEIDLKIDHMIQELDQLVSPS